MRYLLLGLILFSRLVPLQAQPLVHQEPRHRPVFENDKVRILDVRLPPGDTTQYHIHHTPSLFVFFTSTTTGSQLQGAAPARGHSTAGTLLFENLSPPHVRVHRVWNMDADTFHVMDVELLSKDTGFAQKALTLPHLQAAVDTPWVRAYQLTLEAGNEFSLRETKRSLLVVSLEATPVQMQQGRKKQRRTLRSGSFFWVEAPQSFALKNTGGATAHFALLEVPGP